MCVCIRSVVLFQENNRKLWQLHDRMSSTSQTNTEDIHTSAGHPEVTINIVSADAGCVNSSTQVHCLRTQSNTHVWHRGISAWLCLFTAWGREQELKHSLYFSSWMCWPAVRLLRYAGLVAPLFVCSLDDAWNGRAAPVMMIGARDTFTLCEVAVLRTSGKKKMLWSVLWKHAGTKRTKRFLGNGWRTMLCYKHASIIVALKYYWRCLPQITHIDCQ